MFGNKELQILFHLSRGKTTVGELSKSLNISMPETYRKIRELRSKDVIDGKDPIEISRCPFAKRLLSIMSEGLGMARFLSGAGLDVLIAILRPSSIRDIARTAGLSESHVRKVLNLEIEGNIVRRINDLYSINDGECPKLRPFLNSYVDYMEVFDPRITNDSEVVFRDGSDLVFSSKDDQGYSPTGPSAFERYGVRGLSGTRGFYTTREGELTMEMIFDDAVRISEVENDWRLRMANELFFIKHKGRLNPPAGFMEKHERIMAGEHIDNWPSRQDIEDRMWMVKDD